MANFANPQEDTNVLRMVLASGTAALPSVVFANDPTKGLSWTVAGLRLSGLAAPINGDDAANKTYVDGISPAPAFPLLAPDGSSGAPSYAFALGTNSGLSFDHTSDELDIVITGVPQLLVSPSIVELGSGVDFLPNDGSPLATTATQGHVYLPISTGGAPTGVPDQGAGATFFDAAGPTLYIYDGSAWKSVDLS